MRIVLYATILLLLALPAQAEPQAPRSLSLQQAIEAALHIDPIVLEAVVNRDRSQLAVLRAQLDRFSLKVDASLQEQYEVSNIFGPTQGTCTILGQVAPLTQDACAGYMGQFSTQGTDQTPTSAIGLLNLSARLTVPLFTGFRVTANVARAKRLREAAGANIQATQRNVALDVLRSYWGIRRVELQRAVSQRAIERYDESVAVVSARVRAGLAPPVDLNRIETRRQRELARRIDLEGTAAEGRAQLAVALGVGGVPLQLTEEADVPSPPPADPNEVDNLLGQARHERGELLLARRQTQAGLEGVRIAQSNYYPQLGGVALFQFGNNPFNPLLGSSSISNSANPFDNTSGSLFLGAAVSINLFDTLNTYTAVRDARYEVARLEQEERRLGRLVESDVRVAHAHLLHVYETREPLIKTRDLAQDALDIVARRYKNGDALVLEYLDAQLDLLNAEIDLANSAAAIAQAWGELVAATGRIPGAVAKVQ